MTPLEQAALAYGRAAAEYEAMEKRAVPMSISSAATNTLLNASRALKDAAIALYLEKQP